FQRAFNRGVSGVHRAVGWFVAHSASFILRADFASRAAFHEQAASEFLDADDAALAGRRAAPQSQAIIQGGDFAHDEQLDFQSLRFDVNAYLQRFRSQEEKRVESAQFRADLAQILDLVRVQPYFPWVDEIRQLEEDYGRRGVAAKMDAKMAGLFAQAAVESASPEAGMDLGVPSNEQRQAGGFQPRIMGAAAAPPSDTGELQRQNPVIQQQEQR
ncbi:MAG: hypothetical protein GXP62_11570, partial [Oligoflexia bacterium]|nr:hypothetical protein [Oligoflexia bacterium]